MSADTAAGTDPALAEALGHAILAVDGLGDSAAMFRHRMLRTDTQWEHRRVPWTRPVRHFEVDGREVGCRAFPWLYLVRDLGAPPEDTA